MSEIAHSQNHETHVSVYRLKSKLNSKFVLVLGKTENVISVLPLEGEVPIEVKRQRWERLQPACVASQSEDVINHKVVHTKLVSSKLHHNWSPAVQLRSLTTYPMMSSMWPSLALLRSLDLSGKTPSTFFDAVIPLMAGLVSTEVRSDGWSELDFFILDSLRFGFSGPISVIPLEAERLSWLRAFAAAVENNFDAALSFLKDCPNYQRPETVAIYCAAAQASISLNPKEITNLKSSSKSLQVLDGVLKSTPIEREALYEGVKQIISWIPSISQNQIFSDIQMAYQGHLEAQSPIALASPYINALLGNKQTQDLDASKDQASILSLQSAPLSAIDNLIDSNNVSDKFLDYLVEQRPSDADYIYLRTRPELASFESLEKYDCTEEIARRKLHDSSREGNEILTIIRKLKNGRSISNDDIEVLPKSWRSTATELSNYFTDSSTSLADTTVSDPTISETILSYLKQNNIELPKSSKLSEYAPYSLLKKALVDLLSAKWDGCIESSLETLRITNIESLRDEALNLLACAYWQIGKGQKAVAALQNALEDEYNESLQINIGIVAKNLEPEIAVKHLSKLAEEAPSIELQVEACLLGYSIWKETSGDATELDTNKNDIPDTLKLVSRTLVVKAYSSELVSDDQCWQVLRNIADSDPDWLSEFSWPTSSVPGRTKMKDIAIAKAKGIVEYIQAIASLNETDSEWCRNQRDEIIDLVLHIQQIRRVSETSGFIGLTLLETGIRLPPEIEIKIVCFTMLGLLTAIEDGNEPAESVTKRYFVARTKLNLLEPALRADQEKLMSITAAALLSNLIVTRNEALQKVVYELNEIFSKVRSIPLRRIRHQLHEVVKPMYDFCKETIKDINQYKGMYEDKALKKAAASTSNLAELASTDAMTLLRM